MKRRLALLVAFLMVFAALSLGAAPATADYGVDAMGMVKKLESFGPRVAASKQEQKAAEYITAQFKAYGLKPEVQKFNYVIVDEKTKKKSTHSSANVVARIVGKTQQQVIIGAHYDSVKVGKGADDNASGVAVMLETAKRIAKSGVKPHYTLIFIAFGAEEIDLNGSNAYVNEMTQKQIEGTVVMINLDSLIAGDDLNVYGDLGKEGVYRDLALSYAKAHKLPLTTNQGLNSELPKGTTGDWSDHAPFKAAGIQHVYFESTNWKLGEQDGYTQVDLQYGVDGEIWHTQYDTSQYLTKTFPGRIEKRLAVFVEVLEYLVRYAPK